MFIPGLHTIKEKDLHRNICEWKTSLWLRTGVVFPLVINIYII